MECKGKELFENKVVDGGNSGEREAGLPTQVTAGKKPEVREAKTEASLQGLRVSVCKA
jgi:hypothetical protein